MKKNIFDFDPQNSLVGKLPQTQRRAIFLIICLISCLFILQNNPVEGIPIIENVLRTTIAAIIFFSFITLFLRKDINDNDFKYTFSNTIKGKELVYLYDRLIYHNYLDASTNINHFKFAFGEITECSGFKKLNWLGTLKDLNAFINKYYYNEPKKWEKAISCFEKRGKPIKYKSLSTALTTYDQDPEIKSLF